MANEELGKKMVEFAQSYSGDQFVTHGEGPKTSEETLESALRTLRKYHFSNRELSFIPPIRIVPKGYG